MKTIFSCGLLCLMLLATATWTQAQKSGGSEKAVADLEQQWMKSQQANNPDAIAPVLADGFMNTASDGKVEDKAESLASQKKTKYLSVDYVNLKVKVFGDTAIALGTFRAKGTDPAGKPFDVNERFTDTWVKMAGGKWQCVASQQSTIKMEM
jgi:uncharacterized protein (TIGR02246 family)